MTLTPPAGNPFYAVHAPWYDLFYPFDDPGGKTDQELEFLAWRLEEHVPAQTTVHDLGCGTGRLAVPLAQWGYQVTALDASPAMLEQCAQRAAAAGVSFPMLEGDFRALPKLDPADLVICFFTAFAHLLTNDEIRQALAGMYRLTKPGGLLVLETINSMWIYDKFRPRDESFHPIEGGWIQRTVLRKVDNVRALMHHEEYILHVTSDGIRGEHVETLLRMLTWPEYDEKLQAAGFAAPELYGSPRDRAPVTESAPRLLMVANRPM